MTLNETFAMRFADRPALLSPLRANCVEACLRGLASHSDLTKLLDAQTAASAQANSNDDFWPDEDSWMAAYKPYIVKDGVLQIPVKGVLLHDFAYQLGSWATGYNYIAKALERGLADWAVKGIALVIDSPGGMVAGCFELVDKIAEARKEKPIKAFAFEDAYSAAYAIAAGAGKGNLTVSRTGGVGSVGVVTSHLDVSGAMEQMGYKITFIHAGKHKVDGNAYEALKPEVKARIQAQIDEMYDIFVASVAKNREMAEKDVRATEALCYSATESLEVGFADKIGSLDVELAEFSAALQPDAGDTFMSQATQAAAAATSEQLAAARAEGKAEGIAEGTKTGATAERARIAAILALPAAAKKQKAALKFATKLDATPEAISELLEDAAEDEPAAKGTAPARGAAFATAMDATGNANPGADGEPADEPTSKKILRSAGKLGAKKK